MAVLTIPKAHDLLIQFTRKNPQIQQMREQVVAHGARISYAYYPGKNPTEQRVVYTATKWRAIVFHEFENRNEWSCRVIGDLEILRQWATMMWKYPASSAGLRTDVLKQFIL